MPHGLTSDMLAALAQPVLNPAIFLNLTFGSVVDHVVTPIPAYLWTGKGTVNWLGQNWVGKGSVLKIGPADDNSQIEARGITLEISGISPDTKGISAALTEVVVGLPATIYLGLYDNSGDLIDTPIISWQGKMDIPTWNISRSEIVLTLALESRLLDMNCTVEYRYDQETQQSLFPGDLGFNFVNSLQETNLFWGLFPLSSNNV